MPWTKKDVEKHKKGLTNAQKQRWVNIANSVLDSCLKGGGKTETCEAQAIKTANSKIKTNESMNVGTMLIDLQEVGRTVSKANEKKIKDAITALQDILSKLGDKKESALAGEQREAFERAKDLVEAERSHNELRSLLRQALKNNFNEKYGPYLEDFSSDWVVYEIDHESVNSNLAGKLFKANYTIDDNNKIAFSNNQEVYRKIVFEPINDNIKESKKQVIEDTFTGMPVKLIEATKGKKTVPIKIIQPGWGTSGYYPAEVLKRDAGNYKAGTQMFWDHPTPTEEAERPERSLRDLVGSLVSNGRWEENGIEGPGVYADAKIYDAFKPAVDQMSNDIGLSHRAFGKAMVGEAEGKEGHIINSIDEALSVDFVTLPGAGGKVVELFESYRGKSNNNQKNEPMNVDESKKTDGNISEKVLIENQRLKERLLIHEAAMFVDRELKDAELPDITKQRLSKSLAKKAPATESGELDTEKFSTQIAEAVKEEADYISSITESGSVKNLGESQELNDEEKTQLEEAEKQSKQTLVESFQNMGYSEEEAKKMAERR